MSLPCLSTESRSSDTYLELDGEAIGEPLNTVLYTGSSESMKKEKVVVLAGFPYAYSYIVPVGVGCSAVESYAVCG